MGFNITQNATNNFDRAGTEIRNSITNIHKFFRCHITQNNTAFRMEAASEMECLNIAEMKKSL